MVSQTMASLTLGSFASPDDPEVLDIRMKLQLFIVRISLSLLENKT